MIAARIGNNNNRQRLQLYFGAPTSHNNRNLNTIPNVQARNNAQSHTRPPIRHRPRRRRGTTNSRQRRITSFLTNPNPLPDEPENIAPEVQTIPELHERLPAFGDNWKPCDDENIRFFYQNVNGISLNNDGSDLIDACDFLSENNVGVWGMAETNLNWGQSWTKDRARKHIRRVQPNYRLSTSSSGEKTKNRYQPGGTATAATGKWSGRAIDSGSDSMGRWSWVQLRGRNDRTILVITAYRACVSSLREAGDGTAWKQQWRALRRAGVRIPNPRQNCIDILTSFIQSRQAYQGDEIILMMDANEPTSEELRGITKLKAECGLIDVHESRHGQCPNPTYARGTKKIDHVLATENIASTIRGSGILALNHGIPSDHPGMWVDFHADSFFDGNIADPTSSKGRRLNLNKVRTVEAYLTTLHDQMDSHNIPQRIEDLQRDFSRRGRQPELVHRYEAIDRDITDAMLHAEKKCGRSNYGKAWSPTLVKAGQTIRYWKTRLSSFLNNVPIPEASVNLREKHSIQDDDSSNLEYIKSKLKEARKEQRECKRYASELRTQFLEELAEKVAPKLKVSVEQALKCLQVREETREMFSKIRMSMNPRSAGAINRLLIPDPTDPNAENPKECETWQEIDDPDKMFEILLERNRKHLHQAHRTPFADGPLSELIGMSGTNDRANTMLDGTFDPSEHTNVPEIKELFKGMARIPDTGTISLDLEPKDYEAIYRPMNEAKSSSPSTRHVGQMKAGLESRSIMLMHCGMMEMPFKYSFAPQRWSRVVDVMLEKEPGNQKSHRLRIIVLVESDMNTAYKIYWNRRLIPRAESAGLLGKEQHGNRAGRQATDCLLTKILSLDILRQKRQAGAFLSNDATGCYDRIISALAMIYCQRAGLPPSAAETNCRILNASQRHVRTAHGLSVGTYCHTPLYKLFGEGQGKGSSPGTWLLVSVALIAALAAFTKGMVFTCARKLKESQRRADGFVDDCGNGVTSTYENDPEEKAKVIRDMRRSAQSWERLLNASGGALELPKCYWWLITWIWVNGTPKMANIEEAPGDIWLTDSETKQRKKLKRLEPSKALKELGYRHNPLGTQDAEYEHKRLLSATLGGRVAASSLSKNEAHRMYKSVWNPKIGYTAPVTRFKPKEAKKIMSPFLNGVLPKIGYNRHMPRAVIHGPERLGGSGYEHIYSDQGSSSITQLLGHLRQDDDVATLIDISRSYYQLHSGLGEPVMRRTSVSTDYVESTWLSGIRDYCRQINAEIFITDDWCPDLQRDQDQYIMESVINQVPSLRDLKLVNQCRLYLRAYTLSDLTGATGTHIHPWALDGSQRIDSKWTWPNQEQPSKTAWQRWRHYLRKCFAQRSPKNRPINLPLRLDNRLGAWRIAERHDQREFYYDGDKIYRFENGSYTAHDRIEIEHRRIIFQVHGTQSVLPRSAIPAPVIYTGYYQLQCEPRLPTAESAPSPTSFAEFLDAQPYHVKRIVGQVKYDNDDGRAIAEAIGAGHTLAVSDGSKQGTRASHGWIIESTDLQHSIEGAAPCDGNPRTIDSYRSELTGILALLYIQNLLLEYHQIVPRRRSRSRLFCDNESAVKVSECERNEYGIRNHLIPEYDLVAEIHRAKDTLPLPTTISHVKGHQDDDVEFDDLPREAQLNVLVDEIAKDFLHDTPPTLEPRPCALHFPENRASVMIDGIRITTKLATFLKEAYTEQDMIAYLLKDNEWSRDTFDLVDWDAVESASKRENLPFQVRMIKFQHDWLNSGEQRKRISSDAADKCPFCPEMEDCSHILRCNAPVSQASRELQIRTAKSFLDPVKTIPLLWTIVRAEITSELNATRRPTHNIPNDRIGRILRAAIREQTQIGWSHILKGRISKKWGEAQGVYYRDRYKDSKTLSSQRWQTQFVRAMWRIFDGVWQQRNAKIHEEEESINSQQLQSKIQELYADPRRYVSAEDLDIFALPLEDRLTLSYDTNSLWYRTVKVAAEAYKVNLQDDLVLTQPSIRAYFQARAQE